MTQNIFEIKHPLVQHKLGFLRDENTRSDEFRRIVAELTKLIAYEATKDLSVSADKVKSPIADANVERVDNPPVIVSVMRAGNGMLESMLTMFPFCSAGHIGIYRDKFINNTVEYYFKLPEGIKGKDILLLDPLLATGDTMLASLDRLKQYEVGKIKVLTLLSSHDGIEKVHHFHPDVEIYTLNAEEGLNEQGYLVPGLGDAGDRMFGTK